MGRFGTRPSGTSQSTTGAPDPPEFGSFPLDHDGDCKQVAQAYRDCLARQAGVAPACRDLAEQFLHCRMDHGLMKEERDMGKLGFPDRPGKTSDASGPGAATRDGPGPPRATPVRDATQGDRHGRGFVAGMGFRDGDREKGVGVQKGGRKD